jgi:hypothetical protein
VGPVFRSSVTSASPDQSKKIKEAERRQTQVTNRRILRCGARPCGARTLVGVPPRLSPKGIVPSQRLSFRPGFLGRGLNGRYPPSPVPVQGCTSRPGHNAGGLIPKPPGSGLQTRPRAPPSLPCRGVPPRRVLHRSENCGVTVMETIVKSLSLEKIRRGLAARHNVRSKPGKRPDRGVALSDAMGQQRTNAVKQFRRRIDRAIQLRRVRLDLRWRRQ